MEGETAPSFGFTKYAAAKLSLELRYVAIAAGFESADADLDCDKRFRPQQNVDDRLRPCRYRSAPDMLDNYLPARKSRGALRLPARTYAANSLNSR